MTTQTSTPPASPGFFSNIIAWFKNEAATIWNDVTVEAQAIEPDAVAAFDALSAKLTPFATKAVQEIEKEVANGNLLNSEKRSALIAKLISQAESLGYSIEQPGLKSALNLIAEFAVGLFKMISGQSIGKPAHHAGV